jgi:hypothetical protein
MSSEQYHQIIELLTQRFVSELVDCEQMTLTKGEYQTGVDALPDTVRKKVHTVRKNLEDEQEYEISYNQLCIAFFTAMRQLGERVTISEAA